MDAVKKRLMLLIEKAGADEGLTVSGDWREAYWDTDLPLCTVRLGESRQINVTLGRSVGAQDKKGLFEYAPFSAYIFHSNCEEEGEEEYKWAHQLADKIIDYLISANNDMSERNEEGRIYDIFDLSKRESQPSRGADNICRVIVEGMLEIKREDNP